MWRRRLIEKCRRNPRFASQIKRACKRDILFFVNAFLWLKEPRNVDDGSGADAPRVIPWITWPVQDWWLTEAEASFGKENVLTPKCRAAGLSWKVLALFLHRWLFYSNVDMGLASKNEEKVDSPDDPSSLMPKIDFMLGMLPKFLKPLNWRRKPKQLINDDTHSTIIGYPSTGSLNRGGRNTAFFQDEPEDYPPGLDRPALMSLRFVTKCQFIGGTFGPRPDSAFKTIVRDPKWPGKRLPLRWMDCPPMYAGAYTTNTKGELEIVDKQYPWARRDDGSIEYDFIIDPKKPGVLRSPYFDSESAGMTDAEIARELTADADAAISPGFDRELLKRLKEEHASSAGYVRGMIRYDEETFEPEWVDDPFGGWHLRIRPVVDASSWWSMPGFDEYALGVDVSAGTGASDSSIFVMSRSTGAEIGYFADATIDPKELARLSKAAGYLFGSTHRQAYLVPEVNGLVGDWYLTEIKRIGYQNIYRRVGKKDERREKESKKLGFWSPPQGQGNVLGELIRCIRHGQRKVWASIVYDQLAQYTWENGKLVHKSEQGSDESESRDSHGDVAVACALASLGVQKRPFHPPVVKEEIKRGTPEWRQRDYERYVEECYQKSTAGDYDSEYNF